MFRQSRAVQVDGMLPSQVDSCLPERLVMASTAPQYSGTYSLGDRKLQKSTTGTRQSYTSKRIIFVLKKPSGAQPVLRGLYVQSRLPCL